MKDLLYINYPEITRINANIINKKFNNNKTEILLDRTIFTLDDDRLKNDQGYISSLKVLNVYQRNGKTVHLVEGKPNKNQVELILNEDIRFHNLYYNTAFILLELVLKNFYNIKQSKLKLYKSYAQMIISDFFVDFDKHQVEESINNLINLGLKIENNGSIKKIKSIGEIRNSDISFKSTSDIYGIHIFRYNIIGDGLILEFITGKDFLEFNKSNFDLINTIEKLATSDDISSNKITKIISAIKNNKYSK